MIICVSRKLSNAILAAFKRSEAPTHEAYIKFSYLTDPTYDSIDLQTGIKKKTHEDRPGVCTGK